MTIALKNANFAKSTLGGNITDVATSLTVASAGDAALFPSTGTMRCVIWSGSLATPMQDTTREFVTMTFSSSVTFSPVVRGREGTTGKAWSTGDCIALVISAGKIDEIESEITTNIDQPVKQASSPTFTGETLSGLTASLPVFTGASKEFVSKSVADTLTAFGIPQLISNLKLVVNAAVNKLDVFTKSGGAVPDATNIITVAIPDGNGSTFRSRSAAYLSGTSQFIMADAANYWSKGSLDAEIKTAYVYAIWDGTGIIWALGGYSGFTRVPASTTETEDDFFLLEANSSYTKAVTEYCVCVGKIRYQYDTADTPDHTIQATVLDAPQVVWNPKSNYGYQKKLASDNISGSDIAPYSAVSVVVKQSGNYEIIVFAGGSIAVAPVDTYCYLKVGSSTYGSATTQNSGVNQSRATVGTVSVCGRVYLNNGDTIHCGAAVLVGVGGSGNRYLEAAWTGLIFNRVD